MSVIQRAASNADFEEFAHVTDVRGDMLAQYAALQALLAEPSSRGLERFTDARHEFQVSMARALARDEEPGEEAASKRQAQLGEAWLARVERAGAGAYRRSPRAQVPHDEARTRLLQAFLQENAELLDDLADERRQRRRRRAAAPDRPRGPAHAAVRSEPEAYDALSRHLARSTDSSHVTILNRNNSAVRLEPVTPVRHGSAVAEGLDGAAPDSCRQALLSCEVCGKSPERTTCVPSLVGGEVIGSVLLEHRARFHEHSERQIADSVAEAAPVIANLRNLAIAQMRAAADGLTGLPSQRAVHETLKRMVAQAGRTVEPLALVMFDLDRFKEVNDTYGHRRGDDVLAAVGDVTAHAVRGSDFAGRLGGEEFAVLLPWAPIARRVQGGREPARGDRRPAAVADCALYQAKANGRDRVEIAAV